jgi:hypothetical protein
LPKPLRHTRLTLLPVPEPIAAGHLDIFFTENRGHRTDLVLEYHAFIPDGPPQLCERDGKLFEHTQGCYIPRRLRFVGIEELKQTGFYEHPTSLPPEHIARIIVDMFTWQGKGERLYFFLFYGRSIEDAEVRFYAHGVKREARSGEPIPSSHERDWSPTPPMPARLVPLRHALYRHFGGDPITVHLDGQEYIHRLFIGNLENQPEQRPDKIHAVLNLGEEPSRWAKGISFPDSDRWMQKGEGLQGMQVEEIRREAEWVIERLRLGQPTLVHCVAGMNRSATICCAVLILLEGLGAEQALEHVRIHHPWARPDGHHWLALKWLAAAP